jgi:hypothetical protein
VYENLSFPDFDELINKDLADAYSSKILLNCATHGNFPFEEDEYVDALNSRSFFQRIWAVVTRENAKRKMCMELTLSCVQFKARKESELTSSRTSLMSTRAAAAAPSFSDRFYTDVFDFN